MLAKLKATPILFLLFLFFSIISGKQIIRTVAGIPLFGGDRKIATNANLNQPHGVFVDELRNKIYIADTYNHVIRQIDKNGVISTIVGIPGVSGYTGDGQLAQNAQLYYPYDVFVITTGEMLIADTGNAAIRLINASGIISTIAGGNGQGKSLEIGIAKEVKLNQPRRVVVNKQNEIFICDSMNHVIRKVLQNGTIVTVAGTFGAAAPLYEPQSIAVNSDNELLIADYGNNVIRKVLSNGTMITFAGRGIPGGGYSGDYGLAINAELKLPLAVAVSPITNDTYIADTNSVIRKVFYKNNTIITVAGRASTNGHTGDNYPAVFATLNLPNDIVVTSNEEVYIADTFNYAIRRISTNLNMELVAGFNPKSDTTTLLRRLSSLNFPNGMFISKQNEIYVADTANQVIKKFENNQVSIIAGQLGISQYNAVQNIPAVNSTLFHPHTVVVDELSQELYISDKDNSLIRKILSNGTLINFAGNRQFIESGPTATEIVLNTPTGLALANGVLYIADTLNHVIRQVQMNTSITSIVAGKLRSRGYFGDGGSATDASMKSPTCVVVTPLNELLICDSQNNAIRKVSTNGTIVTLLGDITSAIFRYTLYYPKSVVVNSRHEIFVADNTDRIIKLNVLNKTIEVFAGQDGASGFAGEDRNPLEARFSNIYGLQITSEDVMYVADGNNNVIRKIADLCEEYSFSHSLQQQLSNSSVRLVVQSNRTCQAREEDYFDMSYVPLIEVTFQSTGKELSSSVLDWSQFSSLTLPLANQMLDILSITLNSCHESNLLQSNCSIANYDLATIPVNSLQNFLFFPLFTTCTFINYYKSSSPNVQFLNINLSFNNSATRQIDRLVTVTNGLESVFIDSLHHNSSYVVDINVHVKYINGIEYVITNQTSIQTLLGILPINNLIIQVEVQPTNSILITWNQIPLEKRGNVRITQIEIQLSKSMYETEVIKIDYNADTHFPSFTVVSVPSNGLYWIEARVCTEIGCTNFSDPIQQDIVYISNNVSNSTLLISIIIPILVVACIGLAAAAVLINILLLIIIIRSKTKTKFTGLKELQKQNVMEMVEKEFRIKEELLDFSNSCVVGSGASGSVFTALYFNIPVAVKLIKSTNSFTNELNDFYNELQFLQSNAQHSNIIRFFGVYENIEKQYLGLVMEYCSNGNVANYVTSHVLNFEIKLSIIKGIANGMAYLHHHNVAHRDLKCENVLLDDTLVPKIIDFGFSRQIKGDTANLTMNIGTAAYCAPEVVKLQVSQQISTMNQEYSLQEGSVSNQQSSTKSNESTMSAYDKKCDIYSFAMIMFVIYFQDKYPFGSNCNANQILYQISVNPDWRPKIEEPKVANDEKWLIELIKECWKTNPQERPCFDQIVQLLEQH